jgi:hypothetical protein
MNHHRITLAGVGVFAMALGLDALSAGADSPASSTRGVEILLLTNKLRVEINGQLFTEYWFQDVPRPYCYPLVGPGGAAMTRNWPMKTTPHEEHDHPHHRSLWFAHELVNGHDFWTERAVCGKIVHASFDEIKSGKDFGTIKSRNKWVAADGTVTCTDVETLRIYNPGYKNERVLDFEITVFASNGEVTFGDGKDGAFAVRLAETMKLKGPIGSGHIVNANGVRDGEAWGKRADWCDYYGPVDGKIVGIAMFDHSQNPRHPTWWHVRDYGLFAANPFGQHDFEKLQNKTAGNMVVPSGKSVTFRYRVYLHEGDEKQAEVAKRYQAYVNEQGAAGDGNLKSETAGGAQKGI